MAFTGLLASHLWRMASQCRSLFSPFVCGCGKALQPCIVCVVVLPGLLYTCMYLKKCLWTAESLVQQFRLILIVCSEEKTSNFVLTYPLLVFMTNFLWCIWEVFCRSHLQYFSDWKLWTKCNDGKLCGRYATPVVCQTVLSDQKTKSRSYCQHLLSRIKGRCNDYSLQCWKATN